MTTGRESDLSRAGGSQVSIKLSHQRSRTNIEGSVVLDTNRTAVLENAMGSAYFKDAVILTPEG